MHEITDAPRKHILVIIEDNPVKGMVAAMGQEAVVMLKSSLAKKAMAMVLSGIFVFFNSASAEEKKIGEEVLKNIIAEMEVWSAKPNVIAALAKANKENNMSMEEIMEKDNLWRQSTEVTPFVNQFLTNDTAKYLQTIQAEGKGLFAEIEITDLKGVIIAETSKTTDYYQADEEWWQAAYEDGKGGVFQSKPLFDESSHSYNIDLSIPIRDKESGAIVGVVKSGVSILNLQSAAKQ